MNMTMTFLIISGATLALVFIFERYWASLNSRDLGTMSRQWIAEQNSQHP